MFMSVFTGVKIEVIPIKQENLPYHGFYHSFSMALSLFGVLFQNIVYPSWCYVSD
jgi:hypothetical protein